jgi:trk system potassium uptake protein TrkH
MIRRRLALHRWDVIRGAGRTFWQRLTPPQLFVGSFALLVVLGTVGFQVLPGLYPDGERPMDWLDSLFISTSAVCVTGLSVIDVAARLTFWGQLWLLVLIQLGGLGMITFASLIIVLLGGRLSLRGEALAVGSTDTPPTLNPRRLLVEIIRFTFAFEAAGAVLLYFLWAPRLGWAGAAWPAVFHAVSAFCNAGFSTFSDNLIGFHNSPLTLLVIGGLIVAGGLGFLTLEELSLRVRGGRTGQVFRLSLHSRLVLAMTALLLTGGWVAYAVLEWDRTLAGMSVVDRVSNALFMSITCRTAGFNTMDYAAAAESTNFMTMGLMLVGGSPGSTAGGVKTTTFALIVVLAWSRFRGQEVASVWGRSVRDDLLGRAVGLLVLAAAVLVVGVLVLTLSETAVPNRDPFLGRAFEAVSGFCTVGLTMGVTMTLSPIGRLTLVALMFVGRVGTMTVAAALGRAHPEGVKFRYAYEDVVIG